eukprot:1176576-Prorocentrum_minimum.AAC.1
MASRLLKTRPRSRRRAAVVDRKPSPCVVTHSTRLEGAVEIRQIALEKNDLTIRDGLAFQKWTSTPRWCPSIPEMA